MKLIRPFISATLGVVLTCSVNAQTDGNGKRCGSAIPPAQWEQWFSGKINGMQQAAALQKSQPPFIIPVIVHVIHNGENTGVFPNLSKAQINSQLQVLNADFSGTGFNVSQVPQPFASLVANCNITFLAAELDPNGNGLLEPGIHRVDWHSLCGTCDPKVPTNSAAFQSFFDANIKPQTIWDPTRYLNIWVSDVKSNLDLLGYATFPVGTGMGGIFSGNGGPTSDGIWIKANVYGNTGSLDPNYNRGRTATHELGHWLGLRHIWGDASCGDDFCADTPNQQNFNMGCPTYPKISCSNGPAGEMFMNFMDYCDDACLYMFTQDQRTRIQTAMTFGTYRKDLTASSATLCNLPKQVPQASFLVQASACVDSTIVLTNMSSGTPNPVFEWSATPPAGVTFIPNNSVPNPTINFDQSGNFQISVVASNAAGSDSGTQQVEVAHCSITSVAEKGWRGHLTVAPNPGSGAFVLGIPEAADELSVNVHNSLGQLIYTRLIDGFTGGDIAVDLTHAGDGLYILSVESQGRRAVKQVFINR
jgi:hypothetical protein